MYVIFIRCDTLLFWNMSGTTWVSRYQRGKTRNVKNQSGFTGARDSEWQWAICKSAPHPRQPRQHPTTQFFTGRMPFLPPNQQHQSKCISYTTTLHPFNGLFSRATWVSRHQKGKLFWILMKQEMMGWQWH